MIGTEMIVGTLGVVAVLILLWVISIHFRVNKLRKEIEDLSKLAKE